MASERDREIWDDATNAVCQAMQEQKMCNCPDGDCLAAKIDFSPEKIATATRPAPAATDTGLVTVEHQYWRDQTQEWLPTGFPDRYRNDGFQVRELVTRSQAEELLAAERAEKEIAERNRDAVRENFLTMQKSAAKLLERAEKAEAENERLRLNADTHQRQFSAANVRAKNMTQKFLRLEADNAALTARVKELEHSERVKGVNTQYANALANLGMTEDDEAEPFADTIIDKLKALEDKLAAAEKALEPLADIADLIDAETEGMAETDELVLHFHDYEFAKWPVSLFRKASAVLGGKL